jgi:hypothetical protein
MDPQAPITRTMLPPVVWAILLPAIVMGPFLLFLWWLTRRDRRRWAREDAAEVRRETRRRLGLPEEEGPS